MIVLLLLFPCLFASSEWNQTLFHAYGGAVRFELRDSSRIHLVQRSIDGRLVPLPRNVPPYVWEELRVRHALAPSSQRRPCAQRLALYGRFHARAEASRLQALRFGAVAQNTMMLAGRELLLTDGRDECADDDDARRALANAALRALQQRDTADELVQLDAGAFNGTCHWLLGDGSRRACFGHARRVSRALQRALSRSAPMDAHAPCIVVYASLRFDAAAGALVASLVRRCDARSMLHANVSVGHQASRVARLQLLDVAAVDDADRAAAAAAAAAPLPALHIERALLGNGAHRQLRLRVTAVTRAVAVAATLLVPLPRALYVDPFELAEAARLAPMSTPTFELASTASANAVDLEAASSAATARALLVRVRLAPPIDPVDAIELALPLHARYAPPRAAAAAADDDDDYVSIELPHPVVVDARRRLLPLVVVDADDAAWRVPVGRAADAPFVVAVTLLVTWIASFIVARRFLQSYSDA